MRGHQVIPGTDPKRNVCYPLDLFLNTKGGTVVIGVSDKGEVLGINIGKNTIENLANQIKQDITYFGNFG